MKVIVTGGLGFIGSHFANLCLEEGHDVRIIDNLTYAADLKRLSNKFSGNYLLKKDICDVVESDIEGYDYLVNFAAETHVDNSISDGRPFIRSNVEGVFNLLEVSRKVGIKKFIQISTDEVYGDIEKGESKETDNLNPSSYYSATKAAADMLVLSAHRTYGVDYIITRTCNNYGEGQHPEKFIPKIEKNTLEGKEVPLYTPGNQIREWIHVKDNCNAVYTLMILNQFKNEIFNIGSGERYTNKEVVEIVEPGAKIKLVEDRLGHDKRYALDCSKYHTFFNRTNTINFKKYYEHKQ